jgi:glycosyltransferase involved in cell wall biosynthesis
VSGSTREFLVRERHVPAARVRLIWNGAPLDEFAPVARESAAAARRSLGIAEDALVVGTIGRLNEQKGHRYLVEAAPALLRPRPSAHVLIVGDGDQMPALKARVEALDLGARVTFAGHRTDVPALLGAIDVFAISSTYEGTPLALFEAMAAGKTIVSTAVDGCREVLEDGVTGMLVPARDPAALAAALGRALDDPALRQRLADAARAASTRYDIRTCVASMESLYDEVLSERGLA